MTDDGWRIRLQAAVDRDGRSMRDISLESGLSHGYLHGILREGKEPTLDRFMKVCAELGVSSTYILLGADVSAETEEIVRALESSPSKRAAILALLGGNQP